MMNINNYISKTEKNVSHKLWNCCSLTCSEQDIIIEEFTILDYSIVKYILGNMYEEKC